MRPNPTPATWPKLSEQLRFERTPDTCQSCGLGPEASSHGNLQPATLQRWREHDEQDKPTPVIVMLCPSCAKRLIEPHPRLYSHEPDMGPLPGAMPLCCGCKWLRNLLCTSPALKANGGEGVYITFPQPTTGFWDGCEPTTGKRTGGRMMMYSHHPTACRERSEA